LDYFSSTFFERVVRVPHAFSTAARAEAEAISTVIEILDFISPFPRSLTPRDFRVMTPVSSRVA
jgi:hypothetical protein